MLSTLLNKLRLVGILEGLSLLLLLGVAMPLKYMFDMPEAVRHVGMAHGLLFLLYIGMIIWAGFEYRWSIKIQALLAIASVIPFGAFVAEAKFFKPEAKKLS
ncbi:DUF3817 domain-containing protein [Rapidithrix thailandica]|uniref:DUF3817 domain-containing protein n=1 Tax=Rapidithrix thailandica TaxID=413964 RepID=A0AAW9RQW0_9BACT